MKHTGFDNFRRCADDAPAGTYEQQKAVAALLGDTCDTFMRQLRAMGLKADNCDAIYRVEAALYEYVKASNPDATVFITAEGFGSAMNTPARERVIAQAASNAASLRAATADFDYEARVQALEAQGLTRSDAQGVVDAEDLFA